MVTRTYQKAKGGMRHVHFRTYVCTEYSYRDMGIVICKNKNLSKLNKPFQYSYGYNGSFRELNIENFVQSDVHKSGITFI